MIKLRNNIVKISAIIRLRTSKISLISSAQGVVGLFSCWGILPKNNKYIFTACGLKS